MMSDEVLRLSLREKNRAGKMKKGMGQFLIFLAYEPVNAMSQLSTILSRRSGQNTKRRGQEWVTREEEKRKKKNKKRVVQS